MMDGRVPCMANVELGNVRVGGQAKPQTFSRPRGYWRNTALAYLMILPAAVILLTFSIGPVFYAFWMSLHRYGLRLTGPFVGLENYQRILTDDRFWTSLHVTFSYAFFTVPITLALGLFVAYLLFQKIRLLSAYRTVFFLPYITSLVAAATVWAALFNPQSGVANKVLGWFGIPPQNWLLEPNGIFQLIARSVGVTLPEWAAGPSLALVTIMLFVIWQRLGYDVVIFLAGLGNIPRELYDAAEIDGAGRWQLFRHITLPLLSPTTFFLIILSTIGALQAFTHIVTMNQAANQPKGGPLETTLTATVYLFKIFYGEVGRPDYSYASAVAFVLFFIILALTVLQRWLGRRYVHYS